MALRIISRMGRCWGLLAALALPLTCTAALADSLEYRVKAAFLFNFTKFVDWPANAFTTADAPLEICVLGSDPFGSALDETIQGKSVNNHPLRVRRIRQAADMPGCEILYFGPSEFFRVRDHVTSLRGQSVLTVSDAPEFLNVGGMIRFLLVDGKVRFEINRQATNEARLTVSSRLLGVAHSVHDNGGR